MNQGLLARYTPPAVHLLSVSPTMPRSWVWVHSPGLGPRSMSDQTTLVFGGSLYEGLNSCKTLLLERR